jgi:tRNA (cytidine/uridine-2'-O-)-methyltransferase
VHVVLVQPEIAPNTGAIVRLCANTGCDLHLIEPLGFELTDPLLRRGGLDYHEYVSVQVHPSLDNLLAALPGRSFGFSSWASRAYTEIEFAPDDVFVFGAERSGLPGTAKALIPEDQLLVIPSDQGATTAMVAALAITTGVVFLVAGLAHRHCCIERGHPLRNTRRVESIRARNAELTCYTP